MRTGLRLAASIVATVATGAPPACAWSSARRVVTALAGAHSHIAPSGSGGRGRTEVSCARPTAFNDAVSEARTSLADAGSLIPEIQAATPTITETVATLIGRRFLRVMSLLPSCRIPVVASHVAG